MNKVLGVATGLALTAGSLVSTAAVAEVSGNIGVASQYVFRGLVFGDPQVSGGVDWSGSGFYAGTWISSAAGEQEVDFYGGWANDTFDVGYIYYYFPDDAAGTADAGEVYVSGSFGPLSAGVAYAPSGFSGGTDDEYLYANLDLSIGLTEKASLTVHAGLTENVGDDTPGAETSFMDYGLTFGFGDLYLMVTAVDFDVFDGNGNITQFENEPTWTIGYGWSFDDIM